MFTFLTVQNYTAGPSDHYGEMRWWFVCPLSGWRARVSVREQRHDVRQPTGVGAGLPLAALLAGGPGYRAVDEDEEEARGDGHRQAGHAVVSEAEVDAAASTCTAGGVIRECHEPQIAYMVRRWGHLV